MVLPFPSEAFNLIVLPALESCFDYQEKNTVMTRKAGVEPLPEVPMVTRPSVVPAGE